MKSTFRMMAILLFVLLAISILSCGGGYYGGGYSYYGPPVGYGPYWGAYPPGGYYHYRPAPGPRPPRPPGPRPPMPPRPAPMPVRR
ncbi:MAG: hypothetical protein K9N10_01470 [Deltaproteobacteria bacterium]|nr:hypothetical protein [Deltaproteobacteria bacterium]